MDSVTIKFTKYQVKTFLNYYDGLVEEWLAEEPKGQELRDARVTKRFFQKLKDAVEQE